ncbi:NgoMIV family type II restriction endonuclease [Microbispora sp. H10836]|uniref:NgoMIV family type II restriction endonuclease n=1 Tax=Microbispora sp. H10836 TaxID=2729106 RepID=UPI0014728061|nr:NgoMIV family type II restriction endonuclease [Microbispora sp. H10836]
MAIENNAATGELGRLRASGQSHLRSQARLPPKEQIAFRGDRMTAPSSLTELFLWQELDKGTKAAARQKVTDICGRPWRPNIADIHSTTSLRIANYVYTKLGVSRELASGEQKGSAGNALERAAEQHLLQNLDTSKWTVKRNAKLDDYVQYEHLGKLRSLLANDEILRDVVGTEYTTNPDVVVGRLDGDAVMLHAVISCKWTIRSDRVQNVRHESNTLIAARRGRAPHIVAVTAEPLPSRIAALVGGVGGVDTVYHVAFTETGEGVTEFADERTNRDQPSQLEQWDEMVKQKRLKSFDNLVTDLINH